MIMSYSVSAVLRCFLYLSYLFLCNICPLFALLLYVREIEREGGEHLLVCMYIHVCVCRLEADVS